MAVTGYADARHRRLAAEAGFDLYLIKPVELKSLERLLAAARDRGSPGDGVAPDLVPPSRAADIQEDTKMMERPRAVAFDIDPESLVTLQEAFPGWDIEATDRTTVGSLAWDWRPASANLLVVGDHKDASRTLGLCRGLRGQSGRAETPLLVLVPPAREALVRAALGAGVHSCLVLPVHPKELVSSVARALAGNRPGRHTLDLDRPQREDPWRDAGGEA